MERNVVHFNSSATDGNGVSIGDIVIWRLRRDFLVSGCTNASQQLSLDNALDPNGPGESDEDHGGVLEADDAGRPAHVVVLSGGDDGINSRATEDALVDPDATPLANLSETGVYHACVYRANQQPGRRLFGEPFVPTVAEGRDDLAILIVHLVSAHTRTAQTPFC